MTDYIEPPRDLPLSSKVKSLRKTYDDAVAKLDEYKRNNAQYAPRKTLNALDQYVYHVSAIREAETELQEKEIAAAAAGKPLPDRDTVLRPIEAKVDEYKRMVPALEALVTRARNEFSQALREDLVSMGLRESKAAQKARDDWEKAYKAALAARENLERHGALFVWCATAGQMETLPLEGASEGNRAEAWQIAEDGRLTTEAAIELGFEGIGLVGGLVVMPEPVRDEQAEADAEFWRTYKPKMFIAKPEGYGNNWEH
ncbi:hypothetical protein E0500_038515 [Streptomyces sp. KM273126]|uniref:hypothetical protein n=1 Tax=Streptomyces sp. KM273126 TaxID=2545247 RepID=UPI00103E4836|nr:hypothetical protein [Streptomyces sp. KM273126]MBA2813053.1 hypothetical protein [Streptomyces sp. KM273126]